MGNRGRRVRQLPRAQGVTVRSLACCTCKIFLGQGILLIVAFIL